MTVSFESGQQYASAQQKVTSDATIIRTVKAVGYSGMSELCQQLAVALRNDLKLASRMTRTLDEVAGDASLIFARTLRNHRDAMERLSHVISPFLYQSVVDAIAKAPRMHIFGIGPSSALAIYLAYSSDVLVSKGTH